MSTFEGLGLHENLLTGDNCIRVYPAHPHSGKSNSCFIKWYKRSGWSGTNGNRQNSSIRIALIATSESRTWFPQALVVCPTRELCMQIVSEMELFKKFMTGSRFWLYMEEHPLVCRSRDLKRGVQIVVATPGRLIDLIERKAINLEEIKYVVLDEADEMLNMGFQDDIEFILQNTPKRDAPGYSVQRCLPEIKRVSRKYMKEPMEITVGKRIQQIKILITSILLRMHITVMKH